MDVESLRAELETHLAKNPDPDAPGGFRDRFDTLVEQYNAPDDDVPKPKMEAMLQQIRDEAEAAWCCVEHARGEDAPPHAPAPPRAEPAPRPVDPAGPVSEGLEPQVSQPAGFLQRYGIALVVALVVIAGGWYFFGR